MCVASYVLFALTVIENVYFISKGLECDQFDNPADFILDKITEAEEDLNHSSPLHHYNCMYTIL